MPHVIFKLWPGKSEQQKQKLAEGVTNAALTSLGYGEESVSVSLEEIAPGDLDGESLQDRHHRRSRQALQTARLQAVLIDATRLPAITSQRREQWTSAN